MIPWLIDTLVATGALMAVVLLLRRPIARAFGPGVAYALWALPLIRLILPPLMLPASFAPREQLPGTINEVLVIAVPSAVTRHAAESDGWSLIEASIAIWLCGAVALLIWRAWSYAAMRRRLLENSRPMGEADKVRIIETRAVTAPVAFGVFDKVVALPWGFMASPDRRSRNFALEHEFEHHAGRDLAVNLVFQPLLALHWFNPLGWLAWRAMRRDQEAACDARVLAGRGTAAREAYARLIAGYAVGNRLALVAPMACPVLGDKSIVQRLKCLSRPEMSSRRRAAGGAFLATTALAVPLTATICYAEPDFAVLPGQASPVVASNTLRTQVVSAPAAKAPTFVNAAEVEQHVARAMMQASHSDRWASNDAWAPPAPPEPPAPPAPAVAPAPPVPPVPPIPPVPSQASFGGSSWVFSHGDNHFTADSDCSEEADAMAEMVEAGRDTRQARARFAKCTSAVANLQAIEGLRDAREGVASDESMPESVRRKIIENFDRQIERLARRI